VGLQVGKPCYVTVAETLKLALWGRSRPGPFHRSSPATSARAVRDAPGPPCGKAPLWPFWGPPGAC